MDMLHLALSLEASNWSEVGMPACERLWVSSYHPILFEDEQDVEIPYRIGTLSLDHKPGIRRSTTSCSSGYGLRLQPLLPLCDITSICRQKDPVRLKAAYATSIVADGVAWS